MVDEVAKAIKFLAVQIREGTGEIADALRELGGANAAKEMHVVDCGYLDGAKGTVPGCVIQDGIASARWVKRGNVRELECIGCGRTAAELGGDWPEEN
jgi:hypothetical protein